MKFANFLVLQDSFLMTQLFSQVSTEIATTGTYLCCSLTVALKSWEKHYRSVPHSARHVPDKYFKVSKNLSVCVLTPWRQIRLVCFIKKESILSSLFKGVAERETEKKTVSSE